MANDVINPYQTFRDKRGKALAGGSLIIRINRTTTVGTAFSDSALTTAQDVDPYRLDNFGRVRGDLRWAGERTVLVRDKNDATVRTLNDVVTAVDTTGFAINVASVAAMVASTTLALGDVVETQSYTADQNQGGARYVVVATATGTEDDYVFHDLPNTTPVLQAELLDQEQNNNFYVAGAVGNGIADDTAPVQALLDIGSDIVCADGTFLSTGLTLSQSARIHGDGTLKSTTFTASDMIALSGANLLVTFDGITIDGNSGSQSSTATVVSVASTMTATAGNTSVVSFNNVTFQNGANNDVDVTAADDGQIVLALFSGCRFLGGLESTAAPYTTAYATIKDGASATFEDCYFDLETTPAATGGRAGIITSNSAFTNPGYLSVSNCTFNRVGADSDATAFKAAVHALEIEKLIVDGNRILTPHVGGIVWGAEVNVVVVSSNLIDSGGAATEEIASIASIVTTEVTAGADWLIDANSIIGSTSNAMLLDGAAVTTNSARLSITNNHIDSPAAAGILLENFTDVEILGNYINMEVAASVAALSFDTDGVEGNINIKGNTIVNVDSVAINHGVTSAAVFVIDGNTIEDVTSGTGILVANATTVIVTNNALNSVATILIDLDTITTAVIDGNSYVGAAPTSTIIADPDTITTLTVGENFMSPLDSAITALGNVAAIDIVAHYHTLGTTTVTSATFNANIIGWLLVLTATGAVIVEDSATILLAGGLNLTMAATDTLTLAWNGSAFVQAGAADNT